MSALPCTIFLGDLVRAYALLGMDGTIGPAIAALLGFRSQRPFVSHAAAPSRIAPLQPQEPEGYARAAPAADVAPAAVGLKRDEPTVLPFEFEHSRSAFVLAGSDEAPIEQTTSLPRRPDSLLNARWARGIVKIALVTTRLSSEVDVPRAVDVLARRTLSGLPRLHTSTLGRGCQLLVDFAAGMAPFTYDREDLVGTIRAVVGRETVSVLSFEGCPLTGIWSDDAPEPRLYRPPARGVAVAVATDLGIAQAGTSSDSRSWLILDASLRAAGCPLVVFVPYPPRRWPAVLAEKLAILQWDRNCTALAVRRVRERHGA